MSNVVVLAKVRRSAIEARRNPSGLALSKINGCDCNDLVKGTKRRRKLRGSTKQYLDWLHRETAQLAPAIAAFFEAEAKHIATQLAREIGLAKVKKPNKAVDDLKWKGWDVLYGIIKDAIKPAHRVNSKQGLAMVGVEETAAMLEQLDEAALEYAENRAAELVGMRVRANGKLVRNPNAEYAITETTREELRALVADAVEQGMGTKDLALEILDSYAFSAARAETIARTELAFAHVEGNMAGWRESGVVEKKQSILGSEHDLDDVCNDNADAGPIPFDDEFPSGHQGPPYHPNCVCDVIPIVAEE